MEASKAKNDSEILKLLPPIDALLQTEKAKTLLLKVGAKKLTKLARQATDELRLEVQNGLRLGEDSFENVSRETLLELAAKKISLNYEREKAKSVKKVINATGVIIHTNLGRAPLSENAQKAIIQQTSRYCALEYDIETGKRGKRGERAEMLLAEITGAEAALIVNNCAAAAILVLTALCKDGEAIVSRGELVEIGGDFRVPDVMEQSGATMKEVGTTNRTKLSDYKYAITDETRMLVKVHPSNYRIVGFTSVPTVAELAELAHQNDLLLFEDAGSGAIFDLTDYGLTDEPVIGKSIADGADIVTFSGDKLLGSAQSGLIVGKKEVIEKLRKHPFYRALRASKLIYAALEATLEAFQRETHFEEIPVLKMLSMTNEEIEKRVSDFAAALREKLGSNSALKVEIIEGRSVIGGGSAPMVQPVSKLIALSHKNLSVNDLEKTLRVSKPPVITRILEDKVLIDLRTISEHEESEIIEIFASLK
jgi:L-seryl-tRNA(Ser) seleniumtransferase